MKKKIIFIMTAVIMIFNIIPVTFADAAANINIGDYIQMGQYYGAPILWRCVDIDENGPLMLSDRIICLKAFDAQGDNTSGSHGRGYDSGNYRKQYGSNYWADSNIRCWLNSEASAGNVVWACGNPPDEAHMWSGYNEYDKEAGFMTSFSAGEKKAIKEVTQKSLLDRYEYPDMSGYGSGYHTYNSNISGVVANYDTAYSEQVTDKVFLLDVKQINKVYQNDGLLGGDNYYIGIPTAEAVANSEYKSSSLTAAARWWSWLRSPYDYSGSYYVRDVDSDGVVFSHSAFNDYGGVRPAFYLNLSSLIIKGGSGAEADPYTIFSDELPNYTITFTGAYEGEQTGAYLSKAELPEPPYGYTYTFTVNGKEWDGIVRGDTAVTVTQTANTYTVTYTGGYSGTDEAQYLQTVTLPEAPYGYTYGFTVNGEPWNGVVTGDMSVTVAKTPNIYTVTFTGDHESEQTGAYLSKAELPEPPDGYALYIFTVNGERWDGVVRGDITVTVTAVPDNLGILSVLQATDNSMTLKLDKPIVGDPVLKVFYGSSQDRLDHETTAVVNPETENLYISGLPSGTEFYLKAAAIYDDIRIESTLIRASTTISLSDECYVLNVLSPSGGTIDHNAGTISDLRVMNRFEEIQVDVEVSPGAIWDLYYTPTSERTYPDRILSLNAGRTRTAYIKVTAEDGTKKTYSISIYRQTKSDKPVISASGNTVTITSENGKKVIYTTDGSIPGELNGTEYTEPFAVPYGTVIKAVALQENKDEYSDVEVYLLSAQTAVCITPFYVINEGGKAEFEFYIEAGEALSGTFMIGFYDENDKLISIYKTDALSGENETLISDEFAGIEGAYSYKAFLWSDISSMRPYSDTVSGVIE